MKNERRVGVRFISFSSFSSLTMATFPGRTTLIIPLTCACPLETLYNNMVPLARMLGLEIRYRDQAKHPRVVFERDETRVVVRGNQLLAAGSETTLEHLQLAQEISQHIHVASGGRCQLVLTPEQTRMLQQGGPMHRHFNLLG